jgi:hypothetical protein
VCVGFFFFSKEVLICGKGFEGGGPLLETKTQKKAAETEKKNVSLVSCFDPVSSRLLLSIRVAGISLSRGYSGTGDPPSPPQSALRNDLLRTSARADTPFQ